MPKTPDNALRSFVTQSLVPQPANLRVDQRMYPKLTVVTPSYNQAIFLERTILSVLNQQYPNLEYFIIDGGSTDGSLAIIEKYAPYLTAWVSEKDGGQTEAINRGITWATGDYIAFQNSDDLFAPGAFNQVAHAWQQTPDTDVFFGDMYIVDENDVISEELKMPPFCAECQVYEGMQMYNQSLFIRRERLLQTGQGLDASLRFAIDYEVVTRLAVLPDVQFQHVSGFWGAFRTHADAKTSLISDVGKAEHQQIKDKYRPFLRSNRSEEFWQRYCQLRKLALFAFRGDWRYVRHRLQLRNSR